MTICMNSLNALLSSKPRVPCFLVLICQTNNTIAQNKLSFPYISKYHLDKKSITGYAIQSSFPEMMSKWGSKVSDIVCLK